MKRIRIEYLFTDEEWARMRNYYREKDIRGALREAGLSELSCLVDDREDWAKTEESSNASQLNLDNSGNNPTESE